MNRRQRERVEDLGRAFQDAVTDVINMGEEELKNNLKKLWNSYYQLSNEEVEIIKKIVNKI
jgi:hypothetical protein